MKDIYELLNDISIDADEFEKMEVSEFEKAKLKKHLKKSINRKNKTNSLIKSVAAAAIVVGLSVTTFGVTFPAYAKNIPVINDIFRFFDQRELNLSSKENISGSNSTQEKETGLLYDYKKFSSEINMIQESNGIKFSIIDAIFDGKTATFTYTIESEQELGNAGISSPKIEGMNAMGGTSTTTKIDNNKYVGILTASNLENKKLDIANIEWNIDSIQNPENQTEIKGDWKFSFSLNAIDSQNQLSDSSSQKNGVKVTIENISVTPMSFSMYYNQEVSQEVRNTWDSVFVDLEIRDDLGNIYSGQGNGGIIEEATFNSIWSKTFEKLDENAAKLIITPHVSLTDYNSENYSSVTITNAGMKEIPLPVKPGKGKKEFVLEDIIINLNK
jgi:hypothetical protein